MSPPIAKKHFGQHFLVNAGVIQKIMHFIDQIADPSSVVLEIGPGPGVLTQALLDKNYKVIAYEIDSEMVKELELRFAPEIENKKLYIFSGDFLKCNKDSLINIEDFAPPLVATGNLPYNVGSQITFQILEDFDFIQSGCFMLQKEVVEKFCATREDRKNYGPPAIKMSWLAKVLGKFWVAPGSFQPPPKVQSGVFVFKKKNFSELFKTPLKTNGFYQQCSILLHQAFQQRRKKLKNTLGAQIPEHFQTLRPDELAPEEYIEIAKHLNSR